MISNACALASQPDAMIRAGDLMCRSGPKIADYDPRAMARERCAVASPMPLPPPATTNTFPVSMSHRSGVLCDLAATARSAVARKWLAGV